jgi:predicted outer membrane protein
MKASAVSDEPVLTMLPNATDRTSPGRGWLRSVSTLSILAMLGCGALAGCDEPGGRFGRTEGFQGRNGRDDDGWRRGRRGEWHRGDRNGMNEAGAALDAGADAGNDAGPSTDAGAVSDAGAATVVDPVGPPGGDAGAGSLDAGADASVLALSDGQLLLLADALLAGEVDQAQAARASLANADVLAYADQVIVDRAAARSTLLTLSAAIGESPTASVVSDELQAANAAALQDLIGPDAGAIDEPYMTSRVAAHTRALELLASMIGAADAEPLRAQLIVLQAIQTEQLDRARAILAAL